MTGSPRMTSPAIRRSHFGLPFAAIWRRFRVVDWWRVVEGEMTPVAEDAAFLAAAAGNLPEEPWDENAWKNWTEELKKTTGRKGRALFHPLRLALTGRETGPELAALLPLIGKAKAEARLSGRAA